MHRKKEGKSTNTVRGTPLCCVFSLMRVLFFHLQFLFDFPLLIHSTMYTLPVAFNSIELIMDFALERKNATDCAGNRIVKHTQISGKKSLQSPYPDSIAQNHIVRS